MNRLQKKCLLATAGFHLLLLVILLVGPAFFSPKPKPDDLQLLDVIPANAIDAAFSSGVKNAQPPAPTPVVTTPPPQPQPQPVQSEPKPVVTPPTLMQQVEKFFKPAPDKLPPDDLKPVDDSAKPKINLKLVTRTVPNNSAPTVSHDDSRKNANAKAIAAALRALRSNLSPSTTVDMPGSSSVSYASYASIIKSIYTQAWTPPDNAANDEANAKVSITVSSDGTVVSAHIVGASGDASVDDSVQRTLDRVNFIAPFPEGSTEKEKTFIINFNLKAKRMLE